MDKISARDDPDAVPAREKVHPPPLSRFFEFGGEWQKMANRNEERWIHRQCENANFEISGISDFLHGFWFNSCSPQGMLFRPHLSKEEMQKGVHDGSLLQGKFHINGYNIREATVQVCWGTGTGEGGGGAHIRVSCAFHDVICWTFYFSVP